MQTYLLIGAGGTGSHFIAPALAYLNSWHQNSDDKSWEFIIADGDSFEEKNLLRQMFDPAYVGVNKAQALAISYARYPVEAIQRFLSAEDLEEFMQEDVVVFLGVDNYSVRSLVEYRAQELNNCVVINAGNEYTDGSVQLWIRQDGENKTPRLSFLHPEIEYIAADDRSAMTCAQAASLPGGEQLIIANAAAAQHMIHALWRWHTGEWENGWTELQFDLKNNEVNHINWRGTKNWDTNKVFTEIPGRALVPEL